MQFARNCTCNFIGIHIKNSVASFVFGNTRKYGSDSDMQEGV